MNERKRNRYSDKHRRLAFWEKVRFPPLDGCWEWIGSIDQCGYGLFGTGGSGNTERSHRISFKWYVGALAHGYQVLHRCDNPSCVRPSHLFAGTHGDNMADKVAKGRQTHPQRWGEDNPNHRLTTAQVSGIRERLATHRTQGDIAREFGVAQSLISLINSGKSRSRG